MGTQHNKVPRGVAKARDPHTQRAGPGRVRQRKSVGAGSALMCTQASEWDRTACLVARTAHPPQRCGQPTACVLSSSTEIARDTPRGPLDSIVQRCPKWERGTAGLDGAVPHRN